MTDGDIRYAWSDTGMERAMNVGGGVEGCVCVSGREGERGGVGRSEERRVGKEGSARWSPHH